RGWAGGRGVRDRTLRSWGGCSGNDPGSAPAVPLQLRAQPCGARRPPQLSRSKDPAAGPTPLRSHGEHRHQRQRRRGGGRGRRPD
ncbi:unnamed protein product, partial [Ectocarpus sp. 12 AP-2014]